MSQFFDDEAEAEAAPIENPGLGSLLILLSTSPPPPTPNMPLSSSTLSDAQYDQGNGKMPQYFDFFASEFKLAVDTTTLPMSTDETGVSTHLSLLHFAGPPKKHAVVSPRYSPPAPRGVAVVVPRYLPALPEDRWEIKKVLKKSDVDDSSRLLLSKVHVQAHILPHVMGNGPVWDEGEGVEVAVWDMDTGSEHVLVLKKWKTGSFVLMKNWMSDFVRRRGLKKKDVIGLRWDDGNSRLEFSAQQELMIRCVEGDKFLCFMSRKWEFRHRS
ncbi:UNVERIFIED_CONTAM: hypothetical protein Sradi_1251900 [Sesamum radiatum]|uniref:B3 domain-containing protein n=1 Tax=Sesamum radiatum TaxID=300843 RepID=A0AAW2UN08_SESRA